MTIRERVKRDLHTLFDPVLNEEIPDKLKRLLDALK